MSFLTCTKSWKTALCIFHKKRSKGVCFSLEVLVDVKPVEIQRGPWLSDLDEVDFRFKRRRLLAGGRSAVFRFIKIQIKGIYFLKCLI